MIKPTHLISIIIGFLALNGMTWKEPLTVYFPTFLSQEIHDNSAEWYIPTPYLPEHSDLQNKIMQYAYKISQNKDFLYTLKAECGSISPDCEGATNDFGLCQLHFKYHKQFITSPGFKEWKNQINYCWEVYQDAQRRHPLSTTFYGYNVRKKVEHFFKF